jgi:hypothetical protein
VFAVAIGRIHRGVRIRYGDIRHVDGTPNHVVSVFHLVTIVVGCQFHILTDSLIPFVRINGQRSFQSPRAGPQTAIALGYDAGCVGTPGKEGWWWDRKPRRDQDATIGGTTPRRPRQTRPHNEECQTSDTASVERTLHPCYGRGSGVVGTAIHVMSGILPSQRNRVPCVCVCFRVSTCDRTHYRANKREPGEIRRLATDTS